MRQPTTPNNILRLPPTPLQNLLLKLLRALAATFYFLLLPQLCFSAEPITVIYPELTTPYKNVFESIIKGVIDHSEQEVIRYPLAENYRHSDLQQALSKQESAGIIALGRSGYLAVKKLKSTQPTVVGALSIVPNGISGISLSADPATLFSHLKSLVPASKRVFVVYSKKHSGWLIPLAEKAAESNGLQLLPYPAENLREAMRQYRILLRETRSDSDAIWLPLDKITVNDDIVLPMLLQSAWDNNLAIISNKPAHAKRGVLFAMYPDNYGLGQELMLLLKQLQQEPLNNSVIPLKRLSLAVNLRTAAHLGLSFTLQQQEDFTLTFPSR